MEISFFLFYGNFFFLVRVLFIAISVFYWRGFYIQGRAATTSFLLILFFFVSSILTLVLSERILTIFIGWEGLGLSSFILIIFYQNWRRIGGGLLTLLTNRIGDAVLLLRFSYLILKRVFFEFSQRWRVLIRVLVIFLASTKRAQIPFTRWLPAAIAAPTPVRALVHSSTLVTAGIWIFIRFSLFLIIRRFIWVFLGFITLLLARLGAIREVDGKKVVALSTLSQLGLIVFSIYRRVKLLRLFHLLIHAFAKALLFLIVGSFIYRRFSQQDIRILISGRRKISLFLIIILRLIRLIGLVFFSGFFSKEVIIYLFNKNLNSLFFIFFIIRVISLTVCYCIKLITLQFFGRATFFKEDSIKILISGIILRVCCLFLGWITFFNILISKIGSSFLRGFLWVFILLGGALGTKFFSGIWKRLFNVQAFLLEGKGFFFRLRKFLSLKTSSTFLERVYLRGAIRHYIFKAFSSRGTVIITLVMISLFLI